MNWYKITVYKAHIGAGRRDERIVYVYDNDTLSALKKARKIRGIKRSKTLSIILLTNKEEEELEKKIIEENISLTKVRSNFYSPDLFD